MVPNDLSHGVVGLDKQSKHKSKESVVNEGLGKQSKRKNKESVVNGTF